jgi:hypothetical protein
MALAASELTRCMRITALLPGFAFSSFPTALLAPHEGGGG